MLDRHAGGVDAEFSLEPAELASLVQESARAWQALGHIRYGGSVAEEKSKQYRRSIYISETVEKGQPLTLNNIRIVRPAFGLAPKHWNIS